MIRIVIALAVLPAAGWAQTQIERGEALFFDAAKGCATCHAVKGKGNPVGPNVQTMARISVRALATAVHSTVSQYVQTVKLKTGESFPGMPGAKDEKAVEFYDMSKTPPELKKLEPAQIDSVKPNEAWKHPPATSSSNQQLADIIAYLRYTFARDKSEVAPDDVR